MYAAINGTKIYFDVIGQEAVPEGPHYYRKPICFVLHGGPGSSHFHYLPAINALADTFQLVMIDCRNTGLSPRGDWHENSLAQDAKDVDALREYLGLDKIFVLGQSYGGMQAQKYAIEYQEHVLGLILTSTAPDYRLNDYATPVVERRGTEEQKEQWRMKQAGEITDLSDYMAKMASLYHYRCDTPEEIQAIADGYTLSRKLQNTSVNKWQREGDGDLTTFDLKPGLRTLTCPTLIICGAEDFITAPINSEHIKENIPHAEYHCLERACHDVYNDRPDAVFPLIKDFANRIAPREYL